MDVRQAVIAAKDYVNGLFADDGLANLRLEEVEFDEDAQTWNITLGLLRHAGTLSNDVAAVLLAPLEGKQERDYKVVRVDDRSSKVLSVKNRDPNG
jgi:hypothetical protein